MSQWRRCIDCNKRRARPNIERCRQCHGQALLDALDRVQAKWDQTDFHRWQHEQYGLTPEHCTTCQAAEQARQRLARAA